tara:strand:- start:3534 stop:5618 length:2085 start_codon:yes stop_codon:yes gene_type:complete
MALVLIESPNKISKLSQILGPNYKIMATVGHIMDLSKKNMGIDIDNFEPSYKVSSDKKDVVSSIKKEAQNHDTIYIATDPDREGEAIAHHIYSQIPKRGKSIHRVLFNAITKEAVTKAIGSPTVLNNDLYNAQKARRITDRLVGFKVSPVMWIKGLKNTSAGRVQSVALNYIAAKEKEIRAFKSEEFWKITVATDSNFEAEFFGKDNKKFVPKNKKEADYIINGMNKDKSQLTVSEYTKKERARKPYAPFTTATLQQSASNRLGWNSKKTMSVAQSLFSYGLITYHRTDSVSTDPNKLKDLRKKIESLYGKPYLSKSTILYKDKSGTQAGHEAIRPTYEQNPPGITKDQLGLLSLISNRFMASQMSSAKFDQASIKLDYSYKKEKFNFKVNGSVLKFDGFLKVYGYDKNDVVIPSLSVGKKVSWSSVVGKQHFTQPPPRYTDAGLIKRLEKDGVGRPSTYASIIDTLIRRKYITRRDKKSFEATEVGIMVYDYLNEHFCSLVSPEFTSDMESNLDGIACGKKEYEDVLSCFYRSLELEIDKAKQNKSTDIFKSETTCSKCSSHMIKRISKSGDVFLGCSSWPKCDHTTNLNGEEKVMEAPVETGEECPSCGGLLIFRKGKSGKFVGCKSYPVCKYTASVDKDGNIQKKKPAKATGVKCQKCNKGVMMERHGKFGKFYGCSSFPKCRNIIKDISA